MTRKQVLDYCNYRLRSGGRMITNVDVNFVWEYIFHRKGIRIDKAQVRISLQFPTPRVIHALDNMQNYLMREFDIDTKTVQQQKIHIRQKGGFVPEEGERIVAYS